MHEYWVRGCDTVPPASAAAGGRGSQGPALQGGPAGAGGRAQRMGVKKSDTKNHQAAVSAVRPVRPPSRMPAALSMNAATCARARPCARV